MKGMVVRGILLGLALSMSVAAYADMEQDCMRLVESAAAIFQAQGKDAALKAINAKSGPLVKGELYVFALSTKDNTMLAHPWEKTLKRMKMDNFKDSSGKAFFKEFREVAINGGTGWVEYTWAKPGAKEPSPKRSYIMKVPGEDVYVGAGYYVK